MAISIESEDKVTGTGWYTSAVYSARDLLELIGDGDVELEGNEPNTYYRSDEQKFKVTVTVEKV